MPVRQHPVAQSHAKDPIASLPLDLALVGRLKATYNRIQAQGTRLAEIFYAKLFAAAPQLRPLFRDDPASQAQKLTAALDAVVRNLERPADNAAMLAAMGKRHAGYGAKPEHYDLVIALLVDSMRELLAPVPTGPDAALQQSLEEWRMALRLISKQMIAPTEEPPELPAVF